MSDARALEAVTEVMRGMVDAGVKRVSAGARAIAAPPHEVTSSSEQRINVFCYGLAVDASLRNADPIGVAAGEAGRPALPLVLRYLLTPYSPDGDDLVAQRLLGGALQALHSHPLLTREDLSSLAAFSDLSEQVEQVRISWQPLDDRDMFSLWSVFQAPYRLSVAFEVRVVQIDSSVRGSAPLPVLRRGVDGSGATVAGSVQVATLDEAVAPLGQPAAETGEVVELRGMALAADEVAVLLTHPALAVGLTVNPDVAGDRFVRFTVPDGIPAGTAQVSLRLATAGTAIVTNQLPLAVAPAVTSALPLAVARVGGTATIRVGCRPALVAGQRVVVLLGSMPVPADTFTDGATAVTITVPDATTGTFALRLRVDGTDSRLIADRTAQPPAFDPTRVVIIS